LYNNIDNQLDTTITVY